MIKPSIPCCPGCGSKDISGDAAVRWCAVSQAWEVSNVYDSNFVCDDCDEVFDDPKWRDATPEESAPAPEGGQPT
jgi:hypothetical protein